MNKSLEAFGMTVSDGASYTAAPTGAALGNTGNPMSGTPIAGLTTGISSAQTFRRQANKLIDKSVSRLRLSDETVQRAIIFAVALTFAICVTAVLLVNSDPPLVGALKP
jgi:hypothetical protein